MRVLALDVGEKRIGVAFADTSVRIAVPREMIPADGAELQNIAKALRLERADVLIVGLPRNSQGEITKQSEFVQDFVQKIKDYLAKNNQNIPPIEFRDESLTSVLAEQNISENHKNKHKKAEVSRKDRANGLVDSEAACIILQDYLENMNID